MPTEWIRQRVTPSLVTRYEKEMAKLRGETSGIAYVVGNIKKLNEEVDKIDVFRNNWHVNEKTKFKNSHLGAS